MRTAAVLALSLLSATTPVSAQENNDFYDNVPLTALEGPQLEVAGEVSNPGPVDLVKLPLRSVLAREVSLEGKAEKFIGAYRYDGYSLFDILKERFVDKVTKTEFPSVIDLLVAVENRAGEKVVLSWGEIFYPNELHRIIIAVQAAPIIPTLTKEQWPMPAKTRLVIGNDLRTSRNLEEPVRITVFSARGTVPVHKGLKPLVSAGFKVFTGDGKAVEIAEVDPAWEARTFPSVFYGRGKGYHGIERFRGPLLRSALGPLFPPEKSRLARGYFVLSGADGYRIAVTYSELFNRNDNAEFLLVDKGKNDAGGRFSVFPAPDFFSDRAVRALAEARYLEVR